MHLGYIISDCYILSLLFNFTLFSQLLILQKGEDTMVEIFWRANLTFISGCRIDRTYSRKSKQSQFHNKKGKCWYYNLKI